MSPAMVVTSKVCSESIGGASMAARSGSKHDTEGIFASSITYASKKTCVALSTVTAWTWSKLMLFHSFSSSSRISSSESDAGTDIKG
eukprot:Skav215359  [mRNA]  locus=scaffold1391:539434:539694:+ [translate_table: standard]